MYLPYNTLSALERRGINSVVIMIILMLIKHFQEKTLRVIFFSPRNDVSGFSRREIIVPFC